MFWRACAAQFKLKRECAVLGAKTRCNIWAICRYIFIYGGQTSAKTVMTVAHSRAQSMTSTSTDDVRLLSMNFDFPSRLVLSQLFQRQEHSWFSLAENLQTAVDF